jgi:iron(III) transport system ATP-binding protein
MPAPDQNTVLELHSIGKQFGDSLAVHDFSLTVREGEIIALLGPSGCGKTTTLRMVAGLEDPSAGEIIYDGRVVASAIDNTFVPPNKRNMGIVFQSYALWPHMTVYGNVAHPLKLRRRPKAEIRERVAAVLDTVGMGGFQDRPVPKLSGGQQQRVALARAIVYEPRMLLLDEPFSNLDAQLRTQMRFELRAIQRRLNITTLFVTHDQVEAMSVADRIAVMHEGQLMQVGTPQDIYRHPASKTVRDFLGRVISFSGIVATTESRHAIIDINGIDGSRMQVNVSGEDLVAGGAVQISIRPEDIRVEAASDTAASEGDNRLRATIETLLFLGDCWEAVLQLGRESILLPLPHTDCWSEAQQVDLVFPRDALQLWFEPSNVGTVA